ncbi:MAG: ComEC/Rec2 family competence protein [Anaerolineales bacterium]|nr:ComEC/Rec2 family competence protein [Anaerolineales bacterium]
MILFWLSLSFIAGIIVGAAQPSVLEWTFIVVAAVLFVLFSPRRFLDKIIAELSQSQPPFSFNFLIPLFLFFGAFYYQARQPNIDAFHIAFYNDRSYDLLISGALAEPPDYRDSYTNLILDVEAIDSGDGDFPVSGQLLARVNPNEKYEYGERVRLRGQLKTPPENEEFSYRDYLARQGIHSYMTSAEVTRLPGKSGTWYYQLIYAFKERLVAATYKIYPDPEASLLAGILFGVDTGLPQKLQKAFKDTGTAHIIAISGFNIAIIADIFFKLFQWLFKRERLGATLAVISIFLYAILVGGDPAVMRAAIMGSFSLFAKQVGRRNDGMNMLALVAAIMAAFNPLILWDVGFQLSFLATLGLILYADPLSNFTARVFEKIAKRENSPLVAFVNENVMLTLAAQLMTIPIMLYYFHRLSLSSFVANPFILPVQPAVMILGGLAVLVSLVAPPLGQLLAWVAWPFSAYTIRVVELFGSIPNGSIPVGNVPLWIIYTMYISLLFLTFNGAALKNWILAAASRLRSAALALSFVSAFICLIIAWSAAARVGDGKLHLVFFDVGSADAILIQTPEGRNVLINGGESATKLSDELGRRLPFFSRKLDWLVVASADDNQLTALPRIAELYQPQSVLWSGNVQASFSARRLNEYLTENEIPVVRAETGQRLDLGGGAFIQIAATNQRGSVLLVEDGNFRALLPLGVDATTFEELEFGNAIGKADVLLLANSGYAPSNPPDLWKNLDPQLVVLDVAADDSFGMPSPETLDALKGYTLLRTDRNGWIDVSVDGAEMQVRAEREESEASPSTTQKIYDTIRNFMRRVYRKLLRTFS